MFCEHTDDIIFDINGCRLFQRRPGLRINSLVLYKVLWRIIDQTLALGSEFLHSGFQTRFISRITWGPFFFPPFSFKAQIPNIYQQDGVLFTKPTLPFSAPAIFFFSQVREGAANFRTALLTYGMQLLSLYMEHMFMLINTECTFLFFLVKF